MTEQESKIINTLADCNMNVQKTANKMNYHRNTIAYHLEKIKEETGYDPMNFYDLVKLTNLIKGVLEMDNILYFAHYETEVQYFLDDLSQQLDVYGIPYRTNHRNRTVEVGNHKIYAVYASSGLIGALPGFRHYLNDAMEEEFNKRVKFKLLEGAKELESFKELIKLLKTLTF